MNTTMTNTMRSSAAPAPASASASATSSNAHRNNNNPKIRPHRKLNYRKKQHPRGGKIEGKIELLSPPSSSSSSSSLTMAAAASAAAAVAETTTSTGKGNSHQKTQRIKFHSSSCEQGNNANQQVFHKLDPDTPQGAQRLASRRKAIEKGKNTIGYDEYCRQIPKDKRRLRSMETPSTPDYTLDIPNRQWNGMVKAWRIALHRYDPVELKEAFAEAEAAKEEVNKVDIPRLGSMGGPLSVQEQELEQAKKAGLLNLVVVQQRKSPNDHESKSMVVGGGSTVPFFGSGMTCHGGGGGFAAARTPTTGAAVGKGNDTKAISLKEMSPTGVDGWDSVMAPGLVGAKVSAADDDGNSFVSEGDMSEDDLL